MFIKESISKIVKQDVVGYNALKEMLKKNILPTLVELTDFEQMLFIEGVGFHDLYENTSNNFFKVRYGKNYYSLNPNLLSKKIENGDLDIKGILLSDSSYYEVDSIYKGGFGAFGGFYTKDGNYIDIEELNKQLAQEQIDEEKKIRVKSSLINN